MLEELILPGFAYRACFNSKGNALAISSKDAVIHWDISSRTTTFKTGTSVLDVAFSPDGKTLAVGDWDKTVRLWHIPTGKQLGALRTNGVVLTVEFSDDGSTLAASCGDKSITLWHIDGRKDTHYVR